MLKDNDNKSQEHDKDKEEEQFQRIYNYLSAEGICHTSEHVVRLNKENQEIQTRSEHVFKLSDCYNSIKSFRGLHNSWIFAPWGFCVEDV